MNKKDIPRELQIRLTVYVEVPKDTSEEDCETIKEGFLDSDYKNTLQDDTPLPFGVYIKDFWAPKAITKEELLNETNIDIRCALGPCQDIKKSNRNQSCQDT